MSITQFLPRGANAKVAALRLASSIQEVSTINPDRWGLSDRGEFLRLNFGKIEVLTLEPTRLRLLVAEEVLTEAIGDDSCYRLFYRSDENEDVWYYKSVPGSVVCDINIPKCKDFAATVKHFEAAHLALLELAGVTGRNGMTKKAHSAETVRMLGEFTGLDLRQPSYYVDG